MQDGVVSEEKMKVSCDYMNDMIGTLTLKKDSSLLYAPAIRASRRNKLELPR